MAGSCFADFQKISNLNSFKNLVPEAITLSGPQADIPFCQKTCFLTV